MNPKVVNMNKADLQNALDALEKRDQDKIKALTLELDIGVKIRHKRNVNFGYWSALELLAKLGIFIKERQR